MAASMAAMISSSSALGSMRLAGASNVSLNTRIWSVARAPVFVGRSGVVRCDLGDSFRGAKDAVNKASKKEITREMVENNEAQNNSEKQSVFGKEPRPGSSPYPRSELERRPETGSRDIGNIFAFDGAGPETINGRLAMVGLVWAFFAEKMSGLTVFEQLYTSAGGFGLVYYTAVVQLITFASLVPFLNGESTDARSFGPFRAKAERWNGRLAMLGFLALVLTEQFIHAPVFTSWF